MVFWVQKLKSYVKIHYIGIFYKLKPIQSTTNIMEITENLLKSQYLTQKTHILQILVRFQHNTLEFLTYYLHHKISQNPALLTVLTIVLILNAFLTYTGQQGEQIIAPSHLLLRLAHRVLNTCAASLFKAHNRHWYKLSSWELTATQTTNLKIKIPKVNTN